MRVLWFSPTPASGAEALGLPSAHGGWIRALEEQLRDHVDLTVAFYHPEPREPFRANGVTYHPIRRERADLRGKAVARLTSGLETPDDLRRLDEIVETSGPDLIHVHGTEGPFGLVQSHTRVPTLISIQSFLSVYELKYFSGLDRRTTQRHSAARERILLNSYADRFRRFARQAEREREVLRLTQHLTGRTAWDRRVASVLAPGASYHHLDEVLRPAFYERSWRPREGARVDIFSTTGPNLYKGFETLLRAAHLLQSSGVDYRWKVAGLGADDDFVRVFVRALDLEIPDRLELLGTVTEAELADRLVDSDLYVGVSHIENSPNSVCEAQLLGLPCIATSAGGTPTLIRDGVDGLLVQDGDPFALAGAIVELAHDRELARRLGIEGRAVASARHDRATITSAVLALYDELAAAGIQR